MNRAVFVVPHTHWDREWYQPLELFRWRLVQMIDELIEHMALHPEYRCFNLDGQSIVIDDYLEFRPEMAIRLRSLVEAGRVLIGPWWVQPDEFLPSGESHIRNLQRGIRFADRMGGSLRIGHCADQFGHIAQMPQIMSQLGLTSACLWRGVPDAIPGWSFQWRGPDGTTLPVLYLRDSYSNGWRLPADPLEFMSRVRRAEAGRREGEPALLMNGTDHSRMEQHVPALLAGAARHGHAIRLATLPEYEAAMVEFGYDPYVHDGELRSPDRSNVLVGVLSSRMNLKQRDFAVASLLERYAEPLELLAWLHGGPGLNPALRRAWSLALENVPHDSICGCSIDQTHREMLPRYDGAEQLAREVIREAATFLTLSLANPADHALAIFRPVPHAPAVLEAQIPVDWTPAGLTDGRSRVPVALGEVVPGSVLYEEDVSPSGAGRHLDFIRDGRFDGHWITGMAAELNGARLEVTTTVGTSITNVDDTTVRDRARTFAADPRSESASVRVVSESVRTLTAVLPATSEIGLSRWNEPEGVVGPASGPTVGKRWIATDRHTVRLRKGRLSIHDALTGVHIDNANLFVSEGDRGDEYNADILPDAVLRPIRIANVCTTSNPAGATLSYELTLQVPSGLNRSRTRRVRRTTGYVDINVTVRIWPGIPWVGFDVTVLNTALDHRLRALFSLPFATRRLFTENQFHVAERPLLAPEWNGESAEIPPTTFPQKTFAAFEHDGPEGTIGVAVFNRGLPEGELVRSASGSEAYALTLLRCVEWLSRPDLVSRRGGAGPLLRTPDAQMMGVWGFSYAVATYMGGWREAGVQAWSHSFAHPPVAWATNAHTGELEDMPLLRVGHPAAIPSALHRSELDGSPIVRIFNSSPDALSADLTVPAGSPGANRVDLLDRHAGEVERSEGGWRLGLRPWEIASIRFGRR